MRLEGLPLFLVYLLIDALMARGAAIDFWNRLEGLFV